MKHIRSLVIVATAAMVWLYCGTAYAQSGLQRPFHGLFGGGSTQPGQSLDLSATFLGGYNDNLLAETVTLTPTTPVVGGFDSMLLGDANYSWAQQNLQVGATSASAFRYNSELGQMRPVSYSAGVGFSAKIQKRATVFVNQTVAYSPSYLYALFPSVLEVNPGDGVPLAPDYQTSDVESLSYGTSAVLTRSVGRRGTLSATVDYSYTDFLNEDATRRDVTAMGATGQFGRQMSRNTSVDVGYRYHNAEYPYTTSGSTTEHGVDFGFKYVRPFSSTRRAILGVRIGSSVAELPPGVAVGDAAQEPTVSARVYHIVGDVEAGYQFRRTWLARGSYQRGMESIAVLTQPVFTDGVTASLAGLFSRRLEFSMLAGYSSGASIYGGSSQFTTYTGSARLRRALSKTWAMDLEYVYYYYDFGDDTQLAPTLPPVLERNVIRVGITLWVPALRKVDHAAR